MIPHARQKPGMRSDWGFSGDWKQGSAALHLRRARAIEDSTTVNKLCRPLSPRAFMAAACRMPRRQAIPNDLTPRSLKLLAQYGRLPKAEPGCRIAYAEPAFFLWCGHVPSFRVPGLRCDQALVEASRQRRAAGRIGPSHSTLALQYLVSPKDFKHFSFVGSGSKIHETLFTIFKAPTKRIVLRLV